MTQIPEKKLSQVKSSLLDGVQEWLGHDIPSEGSEDYGRWQAMLLDIEDIRTIPDLIDYLEYRFGDKEDIQDFLASHGLIRVDAPRDPGYLLRRTNVKLHGEDDFGSGKIMFHILSATDLLAKYLKQCGAEFDFDAFHDFAIDEVKNESQVIESYSAVGAYDEPFDFSVCEYQGVFFVQANEFDDVGYFIDRQLAEECAKDMASYYQ